MGIAVEKDGEIQPEIAPIRTRTVDDRIAEARRVADARSWTVTEVLLDQGRIARKEWYDVAREDPENHDAILAACRENRDARDALLAWSTRGEHARWDREDLWVALEACVRELEAGEGSARVLEEARKVLARTSERACRG